ncbi:MAG: hypothetical protein ABIQ52_01375 [Vicinamibacterales bacterium]
MIAERGIVIVTGSNGSDPQRDYVGARTYQRIDRPDGGFGHTDWQALITAAAMGGRP